MFSKAGTYPACGIFSIEHIIFMIICFILVILACVFTRKIKKEQFNKITKIAAIVFTTLEIIKIIFNWCQYGFGSINNYIPLHYCSLFIYSLWMAGFFKGFIKKIGESFLAGGCILAGAFFLISPSSSLTIYPVFHFLSIHSMFYHSVMLYFGLMYFIKGFFDYSIKNYLYYVIYCSIFCIIAFILNLTTDANFMFMDNPWGFDNIPILKFLIDIHKVAPLVYALIIFIVYLLLYLPTYGLQKLIIRGGKKNV